jgi:hypothetical protein
MNEGNSICDLKHDLKDLASSPPDWFVGPQVLGMVWAAE